MRPHPLASFLRQQRLRRADIRLRQRDPRERKLVAHLYPPRGVRNHRSFPVVPRRGHLVLLRDQLQRPHQPTVTRERERLPRQVARQEVHPSLLADDHLFQAEINGITGQCQPVLPDRVHAPRERGFHVVEIDLPFHQFRVLLPVLEIRDIFIRIPFPGTETLHQSFPVANR